MAAASGALAHSGRGEGGVRMRGEHAAAEASVTLQQPEARRVFLVPAAAALASHARLWGPR